MQDADHRKGKAIRPMVLIGSIRRARTMQGSCLGCLNADCWTLRGTQCLGPRGICLRLEMRRDGVRRYAERRVTRRRRGGVPATPEVD